MSKCQLCGNEYSESIESHIIPKFFYDTLKTSTGFLRKEDSPNHRVQDGLKCQFLCHNCEEKFSNFENDFRKNVFSPMCSDGVGPVKITKKIQYFVVSVFWRLLAYRLINKNEDEGFEELSSKEMNVLERLSSDWKDNLLNGSIADSVAKDFIFILTDSITNYPNLSHLTDNYTVQGNSWFCGEKDCGADAFLILQVPHLLVVYDVYRNSGYLKSNRLIYENSIRPKNTTLPASILKFFRSFDKDFKAASSKITDEQRSIIVSSYLQKGKNPL